MRFHTPTTTISLLFLLAIGVALLGYGFIHPQNRGKTMIGRADFATALMR